MAKRSVGGAGEAKAWQHSEKRQEIPVAGVSHLYLIVQPSPSTSKSWAWRSTVAGKLVKLTLGSLVDHDYFAAVEWAKGESAKRNEGVDVREARMVERAAAQMITDSRIKADGERRKKTVQWYYDTYYAPRYLTGKSGQREVVRLFDKVLLPAVGSMPLHEVTRRDLNAVVTKFAETAPVSANRLVVSTKTFFKRCVEIHGDETGMESSPAQYLPRPHEDEHRNRKQPVIERHELGYVQSVAEAAGRGTGGRAAYARAIKLIAATGVRRGEALAATWGEFDLEAGMWTIPASRSKNHLAHLVPLPPLLLAWLKGLAKDKKPADFLFAASTTATKPVATLGREQDALFARSCELAERDGRVMGNWSPHALRRTFATMLAAMTDDDLTPLVPLHVIEALLNHQSGSAKAGVAGVYNKYQYLKEKAAALILWERHLNDVLEEERERSRMAIMLGDVADGLANTHPELSEAIKARLTAVPA